MADEGTPIGSAHIDIRLRLDKLEADAAQIKPIVEKIAKEQESITNNTRQSADAAGAWASALNGVWATWQSLLGTFRTALSIGEQIGQAWVINTEKIDAFIQKLNQVPVAMQAAVTSAKRLELQQELRQGQDTDVFVRKYGWTFGAAPLTSAIYGGARRLYDYASRGYRTEAQVQAELDALNGYNGSTDASQTVRASAAATNAYQAAEREANAESRNEMNRLIQALQENARAIRENPAPR